MSSLILHVIYSHSISVIPLHSCIQPTNHRLCSTIIFPVEKYWYANGPVHSNPHCSGVSCKSPDSKFSSYRSISSPPQSFGYLAPSLGISDIYFTNYFVTSNKNILVNLLSPFRNKFSYQINRNSTLGGYG